MPSSPHSHEAICSGTSPVPVLEFGIPDFGTPDDANSFASFVKEICEHSKRRQNVLIHWEGGIGRTGMVAQYVLLALSLPKEEAAGGGGEQAESGGSKGMPPSSSPLVQTWRWAGFTIEHSTAISGLEESRRQSKDGAAVDEGGREHAVSGPDDAADDALPQGEQDERRADRCHRGRQEGVAEAEDEAGDDAGSEVDVLSLEDVVHVAPEEQLFQQIPGQGKDEDGSHKGRIDHAAPIHEVNPAIEKHEWAEQDGQGHQRGNPPFKLRALPQKDDFPGVFPVEEDEEPDGGQAREGRPEQEDVVGKEPDPRDAVGHSQAPKGRRGERVAQQDEREDVQDDARLLPRPDQDEDQDNDGDRWRDPDEIVDQVLHGPPVGASVPDHPSTMAKARTGKELKPRILTGTA